MTPLIILRYRRFHGASFEKLKEHLHYLKHNYELVLPGEPLKKMHLNVCLTFDDATYDFYHYVYPFLLKEQIKAVLRVLPSYIVDRTEASSETRLEIPDALLMQEGIFEKKAPFCTWEELSEIAQSGLVEIASGSYSHPNLRFSFVNLEREVIRSKELLETKLAKKITSFIYPFGKISKRAHTIVSENYKHSFLVAPALEHKWKTVLRRLPVDPLTPAFLSPARLLTYFWKGLATQRAWK